ncbi:TPA: methyltransferase domain-containing protein [Candidatus Micrarchaeota archaeon]|nr:MAG: hypothetical protein AUJ65_04275 [Candidatus Micrarchaeota archaeon CG1_02_51_15]HII38746.1 methyltransferase domain-containing protein [Candidatus Micrarchaeota archaeon]
MKEPCFFRSGKFYKLLPELGTIEINGVKMHQVVRRTPLEDAENKARLLAIRKGRKVLDVCTGLGYSALAAAKRGARVTTLEADENVLELAKLNSASKELFANPAVRIVPGNAFESINDFDDGEFDVVLHDPPRFSFAGELYSLAFYCELFRVLKPSGKLFHYTGMPGERRGKGIRQGVARRLAEAGFKKVVWNEQAQGFTAVK